MAVLAAYTSVTVRAEAPVSSSSNYQMTDSQFGGTSGDETCSGSYCARASIGSMVAGDSQSTNASATFGPVQADKPLLEVIVTQGANDLGTLSASRTSTKTMNVKIRTYLASGYTLQIVGSPPKHSNHTLATPSSPTASQKGTEQFGLNARLNTAPSVGADPIQVPSGDISFGIVNDNYNTANKFMYSSGDTIAHSTKATGQTDYTISMIINIANSTPAGHYASDYAAVVTPAF